MTLRAQIERFGKFSGKHPIPVICVTALVPLLTLGLAGCAGSAPRANEVDMGITTFTQESVTIKAGQSVHFVDPANGGNIHIICVGKDLMCVPQAGAPTELDTTNGLTFNPGDTRDIPFPTAGTYQIVCTIHSGMVVTIIVQ
jgi:plastocyanin